MVRLTLSDKQKEVFDFLVQHTADNGVMPSRREIAERLGISSKGTLDYYLDILIRKGWITRPESGRGIVLLAGTCPHCNGSGRCGEAN